MHDSKRLARKICISGEIKGIVIYFSRLRFVEARRPRFRAGDRIAILFHHGSSVRLSGVIIGKLREDREQGLRMREQTTYRRRADLFLGAGA